MNRREFLKSVGVGLAVAAGIVLPVPVTAQQKLEASFEECMTRTWLILKDEMIADVFRPWPFVEALEKRTGGIVYLDGGAHA